MWIEELVLKSNRNTEATKLIFAEIVKQRPQALFILGDVVSLGFKEKRWKNMDHYLSQCRNAGINVTGLLGNHDEMRYPRKGERVFQKRFVNHIRTGYIQIIDSIAVVLLNSNFSKLNSSDLQKQLTWLKETIKNLEDNPGVQAIIMTCHHAPYTNSKIVSSSIEVQRCFVPLFLQSGKCRLFITGHAHAFEHFIKGGKDFLVIGGGGGLHQPLAPSNDTLDDVAKNYKPMFHYLNLSRNRKELSVVSYFLRDDFSGMEKGNSFIIPIP